jgi:hypothetical protein
MGIIPNEKREAQAGHSEVIDGDGALEFLPTHIHSPIWKLREGRSLIKI